MSSSKKVTGSHLIGKALQLEGKRISSPSLAITSCRSWTSWPTWISVSSIPATSRRRSTWPMPGGVRPAGVSMYTTPGFANALPGLAHALHSESPVISISGSADLLAEVGGRRQEIDHARRAGVYQGLVDGA